MPARGEAFPIHGRFASWMSMPSEVDRGGKATVLKEVRRPDVGIMGLPVRLFRHVRRRRRSDKSLKNTSDISWS